jgi:hypothetical protein
MRHEGSRLGGRRGRFLAAAIAASAFLVWTANANAVSGAAFTTVNETADGPGHCQNGNPNVNCNLYNGKAYVWLNGGPSANQLLPDGKYFFAVLVPGKQPNPNDATPVSTTDKNLSDEHTTYLQRTFTITNGEVSSYAGPHQFAFDPITGTWKIRLSPYSDTTNNGGVYILAICSTGPTGANYPVNPRDCKYDAFKVPGPDRTPPTCPDPIFGTNQDGQKTVRQDFADPGGIDSIEVVSIINATFTLTDFFLGTAGPAVLTATKMDQTERSFIRIVITDIAGNQSVCDPVMKTLRAGRNGGQQVFRGVHSSESKMTILNGRPGLRRVAVIVNGRRFATVALKDGQIRRLDLSRVLRPGRNNTVLVRAVGRRRGTVDVMISNVRGGT